MRDILPLIDAWTNTNVAAFARVVRYCEGTAGDNGFRIMFGGGQFAGLDGEPGTMDDFADHPRTKITRTMKGKTYTSQAAGAYQYMPPTWDEVAGWYGFKDFSPRNQDLGFVGLLIKRKALEDVKAGRFDQAIKKCAWEWASLPGSPYGQPIKTIEVCREQYEKWGGKYAAADTFSPVVDPNVELAHAPKPAHTVEPSWPQPEPIETIPTPTFQETAMPIPAILAALLPSIISAVPELTKVFASGSPVSERNIKAAEVVATIAKDALGAKNEQEVIEQMQADPSAVATVRDAIKGNWYQLVEVGGGVVAAREANVKAQGDRSFFFNPAVWISMLLLVFPAMLLVDVFYVHPTSEFYSENIRTQIVTAVLAVIMMVGAYWLGTTASSKTKDDTMNKMAGG